MIFFMLFPLIVLLRSPFGSDHWSPNGGLPNIFSFKYLKRLIFMLIFVVLVIPLGLELLTGGKKSTAELKKMSEKELSEVTGQNLLNFTVERGQTDVSGSFQTGGGFCSSPDTYNYRVNNRNGDRETHFARISLDTRLDVDSAGFSEGVRIDDLKLGHYSDGSRIGDDNGGFITGTGDANAGESFYYGPNFNNFNGCYRNGCSNNDGSTSFDADSTGLILDVDDNPIEAEGPYAEFAFEDFDSGGNEELVGLRVGFEKIRGRSSIENINQISTTIRAQDFGDNGNCTAAGHRMTNCPTTGGVNALGLFNKLQFGGSGSDWGDGDGWTEDFWISFNKKDMFWDHQNPEAGTSNASEARFHTDGEGFWIHATDDVEGGAS